MTRILLPMLLLICAVGLFVVYTDPTYQRIKALQAEYAQYDEALTQSSQVVQVRNKLIAQRNTFSTDDVRRLERMLPDNVDNIRLIIDINDIAARYHLQVKDVTLAPAGSDTQGNSVGTANSTLGSVELTFSIVAPYNDFMAFLQDLQRSLRIIDIEGVKFTGNDQAGGDTYTVRVKTYWLR